MSALAGVVWRRRRVTVAMVAVLGETVLVRDVRSGRGEA